MTRWEVPAFGHFERTSAPSPSLGPNEVRIEVGALSLNYRDHLMAAGAYDPRLHLPYVPLSDVAGRVVERGPGASKFAVGDLVCATFSPTWIDGGPDADALRKTRGGSLPGFAADEVVVPEAELVAAPAGWSAEDACTLPCAGVTAWSALIDHGGLRAGQVVLVLGTGGVASFALDLARAAGARVFAVTTTPARVPLLRARGAEQVWCSADEPRWGRAARRAAGSGVDVVVEVGGVGTLAESVDATRIGGTVALIGNLAAAAPFDTTPVLMKQIRVQGVFVGPRRAFEDLVRAVTTTRVRPVVDRVFPFDALPDAFAHLRSGAHTGKVVVSRSG